MRLAAAADRARRRGRRAATGGGSSASRWSRSPLGLATLPFLFNERVGVLGEGIYTNDHAAQLYWADWLQNGFGPEPSAVHFGYPIGPQAVAVIAAEVTGARWSAPSTACCWRSRR